MHQVGSIYKSIQDSPEQLGHNAMYVSTLSFFLSFILDNLAASFTQFGNTYNSPIIFMNNIYMYIHKYTQSHDVNADRRNSYFVTHNCRNFPTVSLYLQDYKTVPRSFVLRFSI